ncbi:hypothetical protein TNCV_564681 [Trichonephila clavipes]|nr:hypothetical protein TNCV_564681 [Trichonephila clavipes]
MWREKRACYMPSNAREIENYGKGSLMVWEGIMMDGHTHLHVFEKGTVNAVRYRESNIPLEVNFTTATLCTAPANEYVVATKP